MAAVTTAQELSKLLSTATDSAAAAAPAADGSSSGGDAAEADRAVGALKQLARLNVTAALLKETEAGKRVNKLSKSAHAAVAAAAAAVVAAWKDCVRKEQDKRSGGGGSTAAASSGGGGGGGSLPPQGSHASTADTDAPGDGGASNGGGGGGAGGAADGPSASNQQQQQQQQQQPKQPAPPMQRADSGAGAGSAAAAAGVGPPPATGNPKRDRARVMLLDGLALSLSEGVEPAAPLAALAAEVEDALWAANCAGLREPNAAYLSKVRTVVFNLKDAGNPDLRGRVAAGVVPPDALAAMSAEDMASDRMKVANAQIRREMAAEAVRGQQQQATTDQFQCGKCKQRKVTYYQLQTRSADEPMTNFCTCTVCGNRWKFC